MKEYRESFKYGMPPCKKPEAAYKEGHPQRAGSGLMDYCVEGGQNNTTIIHTRLLEPGTGNGIHMPTVLQEWLHRSGVKTVVVGHTPYGECPSVMRTGPFTYIMCDTSYSNMKHKSWWGVDNRGQAVSEVLLFEDGSSIIHGRLADGTEIEHAIACSDSMTKKFERVGLEDDPFVGRQIATGKYMKNWVKAKVKGMQSYKVCIGQRPAPKKPTALTITDVERRELAETEMVQPALSPEPKGFDVGYWIAAGLVVTLILLPGDFPERLLKLNFS
mmetsp:Transcript_25218/g.39592  ORF Transcript_25218/g.39592 Transcript_25218/m.39592 type:complete len:273 (+) Transcript_25218:1465-2283(+)